MCNFQLNFSSIYNLRNLLLSAWCIGWLSMHKVIFFCSFILVKIIKSSFFNDIQWSTVSKAFEKSKKIPTTYFLLSKDSITLSMNDINAIYDEWDFLNPNWSESKMWCLSKKLINLLYIYYIFIIYIFSQRPLTVNIRFTQVYNCQTFQDHHI